MNSQNTLQHPTDTSLYVDFAGQRHPVDSLQDASDKWNEFRDRTGIGASDLDETPLIKNAAGAVVGKIAYNGKVVMELTRYKVTALDTDNCPLAQACVLAASEKQAADWLHQELLAELKAGHGMRFHSGIKVISV